MNIFLVNQVLCSIFTSIMHFVYTLSFNGIPFYCGMTNNPVNRYRGHYYYTDCRTYNYVRFNLTEFDRYAHMTLICCTTDRTKALALEASCISMLCKAGFVLLNKDYVNKMQHLVPPIYSHTKKLPSGWFNKSVTKHIEEQYKTLLLQDESEIFRHQCMGNTTSISGRIRAWS